MNILELIVNEKTKVSELDLKPSNLNIKYQGKPVDNKPANLLAPNKPNTDTQQGKMNISSPKAPAAQPAAANPAAETEPEQSKFAKAWDATKKGAAAVGQGLKKGAAATAQGVQKYGPGIAKGAANLATGTVKAAGDIAAQAAGGIGQTVGAAKGGFSHGFDVARSGGKFKAEPSQSPQSAQSAPAAGGSAQGNAGTDTELASLKTMIAKLDRRLGNLEAGSAAKVAEQRRPRMRIIR